MRSRRRERQDLLRDAVLVEHSRPVGQVAVSSDRDVVVTWIVNDRIAFRVDRDAHARRTRPKRVKILRRVIVIVHINHEHRRLPFLLSRGAPPPLADASQASCHGTHLLAWPRALFTFSWGPTPTR